MENKHLFSDKIVDKKNWKYVKGLLGLVVLVLLLKYLWNNKNVLETLEKINIGHIALIYLFLIVGTVNNSRFTQLLINSFNSSISLFDSIMLQNASRLLNLVPMKMGMLYRANILKKRFDLSYTRSTGIIVYRVILTSFLCGIFGLIGVFLCSTDFSEDITVLIVVFLSFTLIPLILLILPFSEGIGPQFLRSIIVKLNSGRSRFLANREINSQCILHLSIVFLFTGVRLGFLYSILGFEFSYSYILILGAVGYGSTILALTPEALGIRELLLGSSTVVFGLPFEAGIVVSLVDRAFVLIWTFLMGTIGLMWFWLKHIFIK